MIKDNMQMIKQMPARWDYKDYVNRCESLDIRVLGLSQWRFRLGLLEDGLVKYGSDDWDKSYDLAIEDSNKEATDSGCNKPPKAVKKESCCGRKKKSTPIVMEEYNLSLKKRAVLWSYNNVSKCAWCGGMRIGFYGGILLIECLWLITKW